MSFKQCNLSAFAAASLSAQRTSQPGKGSSCSDTAAVWVGRQLEAKILAKIELKTTEAAPFRTNPTVSLNPVLVSTCRLLCFPWMERNARHWLQERGFFVVLKKVVTMRSNVFNERIFFRFITSDLCLFIQWSGLPSLSTPQEIVLLLINAQTVSSVWGFTVWSKLRGQEGSLARLRGCLAMRKHLHSVLQKKWDTNALSPSGVTQRAPLPTRCAE